MSPAALSRNARAAALFLAAMLLAAPSWPMWAGAVTSGEARAPEVAPLASLPACEGRLRLEAMPGDAVLDPPRLRLLNPGAKAKAWRLLGVPRLEVLRGGESTWLPPDTRPEAVICR